MNSRNCQDKDRLLVPAKSWIMHPTDSLQPILYSACLFRKSHSISQNMIFFALHPSLFISRNLTKAHHELNVFFSSKSCPSALVSLSGQFSKELISQMVCIIKPGPGSGKRKKKPQIQANAEKKMKLHLLAKKCTGWLAYINSRSTVYCNEWSFTYSVFLLCASLQSSGTSQNM